MLRPLKVYKSDEFLSSSVAKTIWILAWYVEPLSRFRTLGLQDPIVRSGQVEFHSWFIEEFRRVYEWKALLVFPARFLTLDGLIGVLTLCHTGKIRRKIGVLVYGKGYWNKVIHSNEMVRSKTID